MDRSQAKIGIADTVFVVDPPSRMLWQLADPHNRIALTDRLKADGGWRFTYNRYAKHTTADGILAAADACFGTEVFIPAALMRFRTHPDAAAIDRFNRKADRQGWHIAMPSADLNQRLMGKLPELWIGTDLFYVDVRLGHLRNAEHPYNALDFGDMETSRFGHYHFLYDPRAREVIDMPDDFGTVPSGVVLVWMPADITLDPYSVARERRRGEMAYECDHPYCAVRQAVVTGLDAAIQHRLTDGQPFSGSRR